MISYLTENEAKSVQIETSILVKLLTLEWDISRTIWCIEGSDGSLFCIFHALSFELNFVFDWSFPLRISFTAGTKKCQIHNILFL